MSTRVLIIPEDATDDQYIVKPVVERIFQDLGRAAMVEVLQDPHLRGADEALDRQTVSEIIEDNRMIELFLLVVDRDCNRKGNEDRAREREGEHHGRLIACVAVEELEVWMLALHRQALDAPWGQIREDCDPKESYAEPFLGNKGWTTELGKGRKRAMRALGAEWKGLLQVCPEIDKLRQRIEDWLKPRPAV